MNKNTCPQINFDIFHKKNMDNQDKEKIDKFISTKAILCKDDCKLLVQDSASRFT